MQEKHFYCVKCHAGKTVIGQSPVTLKNGAIALRGTCPSCESLAYKIVSKEALEKTNESLRMKYRHNLQITLMALSMFAAGLAIGALLVKFI